MYENLQFYWRFFSDDNWLNMTINVMFNVFIKIKFLLNFNYKFFILKPNYFKQSEINEA